jgi:2-keto-4-pentenoate hydratase/2-oxohepta-3-ene-1,7-dioic acid hydratase in catechol pathway
MHLATIEVERQYRPAIVLGEHVLDLVAARRVCEASKLIPESVLDILAAELEGQTILSRIVDDADKRTSAFSEAGALRPTSSSKFAAPIPLPRVILAIGANYHEHLKEMNTAPPATPMAFYKSVSSVIGSGDHIILPPTRSDMVDWEGEFAAVIGRTCHNVAETEALEYVAGYTILNDVSARDWVASAFSAEGTIPSIVAWEHNILGKLFPTFCPIGPVIVTSHEVRDPHNLGIQTRLNGAVVQDSNTSDLVFNLNRIISYYSQFLTFLPGDIIATGSPSGVGYASRPPKFMSAGDTIEVSVECIGTLTNKVVR